MVTKTGKHHFTCKSRFMDRDGNVRYSNDAFTFVSSNADDYLSKLMVSYAAHGIHAEFWDLVDLDA